MVFVLRERSQKGNNNKQMHQRRVFVFHIYALLGENIFQAPTNDILIQYLLAYQIIRWSHVVSPNKEQYSFATK